MVTCIICLWKYKTIARKLSICKGLEGYGRNSTEGDMEGFG